MKNLRLKAKGMMQVIGACLAIFLLSKCTDAKTNNETSVAAESPKMEIHAAAFMGDLKAIQQHIKAGTDLNQKDEYGSSPLTIATTFGKEEAAIALIKAGADLNLTSADGSTPLHTAAFFGRITTVRSLLENGVDITLKNSYGVTALESVSTPFQDVKVIYDQISKDLGPFGLKLNYAELQENRPVIAELIKNHQ